MSDRKAKKEKRAKAKAEAKAASDNQPKSNIFSYYLCCFCILPKPTRKLKRKLEKERLERPDSIGTEEDDEEEDEDDTEPDEKSIAATRIQSVVRGVQTRSLMSEYWKEALEEANSHWLKIVRKRELAWLIEERKLVARKQVWLRSSLIHICQ